MSFIDNLKIYTKRIIIWGFIIALIIYVARLIL